MDTLVFVATSKDVARRELDRLKPRNGTYDAIVRSELESQTLEEHCVFVIDCRETTHPSTQFVQQVRVA